MQANPSDCSRVLIRKRADIPEDVAVVVGRMSATDTGVSSGCDERTILSIFKKDACALGADIVNITQESQPELVTSCQGVLATRPTQNF